MIYKIRKRTGEIAAFESAKIKNAVLKAMDAVEERSERGADEITKRILIMLNAEQGEDKFSEGIPDIEQVQDAVEEILSRSEFERTAKAYMLYRRSRAHARALKKFFGIKDDLKFDVNAIKVLQERYLLKDEKGDIIETPTEMIRRVARAAASAEKHEKARWEDKFFEIMKNLEFLPNSPTLMNAGTELGQLSACFVLGIEDSLESIFDTLKRAALIQQGGGGVGFSFSKIRPKGDIVKSTKGTASGPVSFIEIFDTATEVIKQGGKRRGANMGVLNISHPDILEFITSKQKEKQFSNFNISAAVDDEFMEAVRKDENYELINPHNKEKKTKINARHLFDLICRSAWKTGDPGLIFIDEINRRNQVHKLGKIEAVNPCGEVPLLPNEPCNLGSINLTKIIEEKKINWDKLRWLAYMGVRFLDNIIDVNKYPFHDIQEMALGNRRIGLGVMGFADMLAMLEIPYDSKEAIKLGEKIMSFINKEAHHASQILGKEKGNFPNFSKSIWHGKRRYMRNCACTTIAPTGTISIIAGCSSGIEPIFALAFMREVLSGKHLFEVNKIFQNKLIKDGIYSRELIEEIARDGSAAGSELPEKIKKLFKTALEIPIEQHIKMQAGFQRHTDNAVSKTINLPHSALTEDVKKAYMLAYKLKCKGITIYRYGSKPEQVLYLGQGKEYSKASSEFLGHSCKGGSCPL